MAGFVYGKKEIFPDGLYTGVYAYGFERPSAIQQRAIMPIIKGRFSSPFPFFSNRKNFMGQ